MTAAKSIHVRGIVQGVGFRPFVFRLARANALCGWVINEGSGVSIHLEGEELSVQAFLQELQAHPPAAAKITAVEIEQATSADLDAFTIRQTQRIGAPSVRVSPDLPVCEDCLRELRDPADPRYRYPYINCTNCGPRYTIIDRLPYDRQNTTMNYWQMDSSCAEQYTNPADRRFHAQPIACFQCGPHYRLDDLPLGDWESISQAAAMLRAGLLIAVKGIGGYHLACDARNWNAVRKLRERKFRKEKPFAVMAPTVETARELAHLSSGEEALLLSSARPIVLARKKTDLAEVAPDTDEIGVMLPYTPLHHLLFEAGAPDVLVMTSANRSSEPIAYLDDEARTRLSGLADAFLFGERPISRRVDDSVVRCGPLGPSTLRRSRGYAPGAVAVLPTKRPILAVGADLKNTVTLLVNGQAFASQHIGDLGDYESFKAFRETIEDLLGMYDVDGQYLLIAHDAHPEYSSTLYAHEIRGCRKVPVQHHRAHIASVLAERGLWDKRVVGVSFDGTGYGDDGTIWGGEFFVGSVSSGFERVLHLRTADMPGGDAAAQYPVQSATGFLSQLENLPALEEPPFSFPRRYRHAARLLQKQVRTFRTTSVGRLFDCAAALLGFTRGMSYEGQAAMWLENLASAISGETAYPFPLISRELDFRPLLTAVVHDRKRGKAPAEIARAFQRGVAEGICHAASMLCEAHSLNTVVLSGGVFQNCLLCEDVSTLMERNNMTVWTNSAVPANDGGISLGQAAMAVFIGDVYA